MIPDHSVLSLDIDASFVSHVQRPRDDVNATYNNEYVNGNVQSNVNSPLKCDDVFYNRYKIGTVPVNFCDSDVTREAILQLIERIEQCRSLQTDIDSAYSQVCDMYYKEMNTFFQCKNVYPSAQKRFHKCTKPFWNAELQSLWQKLCQEEKVFLKSSGGNRRIALSNFKRAQHDFDRTYRRTERRYRYDQMVDIEHAVSSNPREFWSMLKRLGPRKKSSILMEVYDDEMNIVKDVSSVLSKWKNEYSKLYNFNVEPGCFDDEFYKHCLNEIPLLEALDAEFEGLNNDILESEVRKVIVNAKLRKAIGTDNLPNEILKNPHTIILITVLFRKIFDTGVVPTIWKTSVIKPIPKSSLVDPRLPLQYRGISLLSTMYKLYSSVLNHRITDCAESNKLFTDDQMASERGAHVLTIYLH